MTYLGQYQGNCFQKMERVGALYDRLASPSQNPWNLWFIDRIAPRQECDILVSKLLGFETCQFFSEGFCISFEKLELRKKFRFQKIWSRKKVSVSENLVSVLVSENLVLWMNKSDSKKETKKSKGNWIMLFIGPRSDHGLPMSVTNWLTDWLTNWLTPV